MEIYAKRLAISIHAPTRGATINGATSDKETGISIHAPTRGATRSASETKRWHAHFNPRSHERSDQDEENKAECRYRISIHAPTRGATHAFSNDGPFIRFQSTLPREERRDCTASHFSAGIFQSTLPREERRNSSDDGARIQNFNPRSHERSDIYRGAGKSRSPYFNPRSHERSDQRGRGSA